jgi:hypothetical protein
LQDQVALSQLDRTRVRLESKKREDSEAGKLVPNTSTNLRGTNGVGKSILLQRSTICCPKSMHQAIIQCVSTFFVQSRLS